MRRTRRRGRGSGKRSGRGHRIPDGDSGAMADPPERTPRAIDWRFALTIGLSIGAALPTSRGVERALEPTLGYWGAFLVSIGAAAVVAGLVAVAVPWLLRRAGGGRGEPPGPSAQGQGP
jgi:hypothetical protein